MKIAKQVLEALNESSDQWKSFATDKYASWLEKALAIIEKAEESKHIWNVDFEDARGWLKAAFNASHPNVKKFIEKETGVDAEEEQWRRFCIYVAHDRPNDSAKVVKEYKNAKGDTAKAIKLYDELLVQPYLTLMNRLAALKPHIEKGRKPNPNAVQKPVYTPAKSSVADLKKVKDVYEELLKEWFPEQKKSIIDYWKSHLEATMNQINSSSRDERENADLYIVQNFLSRESFNSPFRIKPNLDNQMDKQAEQITKDIQTSFIEKNLSKVTSIVSAKGELEEVKLQKARVGSSGRLNGRIKFTFKDGSGFTVNNQSVLVFSYAGKKKFFTRFPTTFHDVTMSDGKKYGSRSEEQMNKEFAGIK